MRAEPGLGWLLAATDFGDEEDFAVGFEGEFVVVLENLAVQGDGHAVFDLLAEAGEAAVEFVDQAAEIGGLHLELAHSAG